MKIYESTPGGLYAQPGRTVTTFPSGLIRVDQSYTCADANVDAILSLTTSGGPVTSGDITIANATYLPLTSESFFNEASGIVIFKSGSSWSLELSTGSWTGGSATDPSGTYTPSGDAVGSFTVSANSNRSTLAVGKSMPDANASPSIDGLSIFPTVQENRRGDGFTEFKVSAYGRVANTLQTITQTPVTVTFKDVLTYKLWSIAGSIAILSGTVMEYDDLALDPTLLDPFDFVSIAPSLSVLSADIIEEHAKGDVTSAGIVVQRAYKIWEVILTADGTSTHSQYSVVIFYPSIAVKSYRHFGAFVEVDVETTILNTTTDITPAP